MTIADEASDRAGFRHVFRTHTPAVHPPHGDDMQRDPRAAFSWVEQLLGGAIVAKNQHVRWRPQWSLDVKTTRGETVPLILRGFRNPRVDDEAGSRARLRREAAVLEALQGTPVRVPQYYGYAPDDDWLLMERVSGDALISKLNDPERQSRIFGHYIENVAVLHNLDVESLRLPSTFVRPVSGLKAAQASAREWEALYRRDPGGPAPLIEFTLWWLKQNLPEDSGRTALCTGDIGPDQFIFEGNEFKVMFDLDMAYIGDPLQDIGLMRCRSMLYPFGDVRRHIRSYQSLTDRIASDKAILYWTIFGMLGGGGAHVTGNKFIYRPDVRFPADMSHAMSAAQVRRRACAEAFHEIYGLELPPRPERPQETQDAFTRLPTLVADELDEFFAPRTGNQDSYLLKIAAAQARACGLASTIGAAISKANLEELADVLGREPKDELSGLAELQARIIRDPEKDLAKWLGALFRLECRNEYVLEPIIRSANHTPYMPLQRLAANG